MKTMVRMMVAVVVMLAASLPAFASPEGVWEIESKDSRYKVTMCGDGSQLCAELIWLGNGGDRPENRPYLNTLILDQAQPAKPNQWKGTLHLYGHQAGGTITQVGPDQIALRGCFMGIICRTYQMYRYTN